MGFWFRVVGLEFKGLGFLVQCGGYGIATATYFLVLYRVVSIEHSAERCSNDGAPCPGLSLQSYEQCLVLGSEVYKQSLLRANLTGGIGSLAIVLAWSEPPSGLDASALELCMQCRSLND